jgi:hypothetical protein
MSSKSDILPTRGLLSASLVTVQRDALTPKKLGRASEQILHAFLTCNGKGQKTQPGQ